MTAGKKVQIKIQREKIKRERKKEENCTKTDLKA